MRESVGSAIKKIRESKELSLESLAACLEISHTAVSRYESGTRNVPTTKLKTIAKHLEVDPLVLLELKLKEQITQTMDVFKES